MATEDDQVVAALHDELVAAVTLSARLAWDRAPDLCFCNDEGQQPCLAYHRLWQYLALLGIARSIRSDTDFLIGTFRRLALEEGARRVLVSGTADFAMLAHVLKAYELEAIEPRIIVVDQCATPLMLNRWYAYRYGVIIETVEADVLSYRPEAAVDIVCTHSFLGWFSPMDKGRLIRSWYDMLVPGGCVVMAHRLNATHDEWSPRRFDEDEVREFGERVHAAAETHAGPLPTTPEELAQTAHAYARSYHRYPTATRESLAEIFAAGGFPTLDIDGGTVADIGPNRPSGPLRRAGNRLRFVGRRPV